MPRRSRQQVRCCVSTTVSTKAACLTALLLLSECQGSAALPQRPHRLPGSVSHRPHFRSHTLALSSVVRSTKRRLKPSSEWPMASCSDDHHDPNVGRARAQYPDRPWVEGLPDAPKARHRAFMHRMVKFIKARDTAGALLLYDAAEELGCPLSEHVYSAVLSLCADGATVSDGKRVLSDMEKAGFTPKENNYVFLLHEAAGRDAFDEAFSILHDMVRRGVTPRLRSYTPLLHGLCDKADMSMAVKVWSHMREQGVQPLEEEYLLMIQGWAQSGELWDRVRDGSVERFLQELCDSGFELCPVDAVEPVLDSTSTTIPYLDILLQAFNNNSNPGVTPDAAVARIASAIPRVGAPGASCDCCGGQLKAVGLSTDERLRVCSALKNLANEGMNGRMPAAADLVEKVDDRGNADAQEGGGSNLGKAKESSRLSKSLGRLVVPSAPSGDLEHFARWLEERRREPSGGFTTVVDACNVAYFGQNVKAGHFQVLQVDGVVKNLEAEGERVLVVLPSHYLREVLVNTSRCKGVKNPPTKLSPQALRVIETWAERGILYRCAAGTEDDLFWMYFTVAADSAVEKHSANGDATVGNSPLGVDGIIVRGVTSGEPCADDAGTSDEIARVGGDVFGDGGRRAGQEPKGRAGQGDDGSERARATRLSVVTNDEMRNHRMALLEGVAFKRWRNSQVRGFHWTTSPVKDSPGGNEDGKDDGTAPDPAKPNPVEQSRVVVLDVPAFTRDMQVVDRAWHIPLRDSHECSGDKWLCIDLMAGLKSQAYGFRDRHLRQRIET